MNTNPKAKRILCFGDSNTWGYQPQTNHLRFLPNKRWTGVLQNLLGNDFEVIEEGLNSRTLDQEDKRPTKEGRRGDLYLLPCLDTHDPLDLVIIMLGTNELKHTYEKDVSEVVQLLDELFFSTVVSRKSQFSNKTPRLLVIAPPIVDETTDYAKERYIGGAVKAVELSKELKRLCIDQKYSFLDSNDYVNTGADGVHMDEESHKRLGQGIFDFLTNEVF